jgi:ATP-dependent helicase/nuclease subunit B
LTPIEQAEFFFDDSTPTAVAPIVAPTTSRVFLDWSRPLLRQAVDHLTSDWKTGALDLTDRVVIVSTQQAGRRLREALSAFAAERGTAVLPPIVMTPDSLLAVDPHERIAGTAELLRVWSEVLMKIRPLNYRSLFPVDPVEQNFAWALQTATDLLAMRSTLGEVGLTIGDAAKMQPSEFWREPERWRDLARIEREALKKLESHGLNDPLIARKSAAEHLTFSENISTISLLAVPDPTPLALEALRKFANKGNARLEILIYAPDLLSDHFDKWGIPIRENWLKREIPLPEPERSIHVAADQPAVARIATELLRKHPSPAATAALAVCDDTLVALVEKECHHHNLPAFDPSGLAFDRHEIAHILRLLADLLARKSFAAFATLLRCPDLTQSLAVQWKIENPDSEFDPARVLASCDKLQADCLPDTIDDAADAYRYRRTDGLSPQLNFTLTSVQSLLDAFKDNFNQSLSNFLKTTYAGRQFDDSTPEDRAFVELVSTLDSILDQFDGPAFTGNKQLTPTELLDILIRVLSRERISTERNADSIDLQGWLEILWEDAPHLILTGFNDGVVPEAITSDPFLPASSRELLGLRTNEDRFARDAYFITALLASRSDNKGQVDIILGRAREDGEPLRPSRLLFQCQDDELASRALLLFQSAPEPGGGKPAAWQPAWKLQPPALPADHKIRRQLRVTDFSSYLLCPFRFYLKRGLNMEAVETGRMEMDARNYGTITHLALEHFGNETDLHDTKSADPIANFLHDALEKETTKRYGYRLPAPIVVQLDSAKQRLSAAARVFAAERRNGWKIEADPEWSITDKLEFIISGVKIRGTIDRIERNEKTGHLRVIDFKTSSSASKAEAAHLAGFGKFNSEDDYPAWARTTNSQDKDCHWTNLQIPLYILALRQFFGKETPITGGYFNLPKAIGDVGIDLWEDLGEHQLRSAYACAEGVASSIKNGTFWPPNPNPKWDDFSAILFGLPELTASAPPK